MSSPLNKLASTLNRRDEVPNQELARELASKNDRKGTKEIAENLRNPDKNIQSDCIKVLYEIGYIKPELIRDFASHFIELIQSNNNRLVWGGMIALASIAELKPDVLYKHFALLKRIIKKGSVITVDSGIKALSLAAAQGEEYGEAIFPYLLGHLRTCRPKEIPMRAEFIRAAVTTKNKAKFVAALKAREMELTPSQSTRVKKILERLADA